MIMNSAANNIRTVNASFDSLFDTSEIESPVEITIVYPPAAPKYEPLTEEEEAGLLF
jgi:hypothetical protein